MCILDEDLYKENNYCTLDCVSISDVSVRPLSMQSEDYNLEFIPLSTSEILSKITEQKPKVLKNLFITEDMIGKAIDKMDANAAAGNDGISAKLIKTAKGPLLYPLSILWNASLQQGWDPKRLK